MVDAKIESAIKDIQDYISKIESQLAKRESEIAKAKETASQFKSESASAAEKLKKMEQEMAELSSVYEELKGRADVEIDLQEVMRLYVILTEQVLILLKFLKDQNLVEGHKSYDKTH